MKFTYSFTPFLAWIVNEDELLLFWNALSKFTGSLNYDLY